MFSKRTMLEKNGKGTNPSNAGPSPDASHPVRWQGALRVNGGHQADEAQLLAAGLELLVRGDLKKGEKTRGR